ncbi:hypothetical protein NE235_28700 [Actinoallomurus spadix]|uniref:Peptidase S11 D-alanyl-D-alanine carboxypeptidase A N-terminal domain-containing protein n=1 Tax=Actinoallomurus spadix TaxID=79912 RepID=A0ABN0WS66_9ACTN|nr:hypothetical protein [Actinoallomurus spadix]MCO5990100.1 hypothetical protein [Actinoallomurus spadix]
MNDASQESQDDAGHETSGPPSPGDPDGGPEPQEETGTPTADDAEPGARPRPEPGQEESPDPEGATDLGQEDSPDPGDATAPTSHDTAEPEPEPEQSPPATGPTAEHDDTPDPDTEDEDEENAEHPPPPPEPTEHPASLFEPTRRPAPLFDPAYRAVPSSEPTSAEIAAEAVPDEDATDTAEHVRPQPADEPEHPRPEANEPHADTTAPEPEEPGERPIPYQDHTVMDLPQQSYPPRRRTSPEPPPTAPHRPTPPEPRPPRPAPSEPRSPHPAPAPVPPPRTPDADRGPDVEAPVPPRYPAASAYSTAPATVEQVLPARRPAAPADFASTTQRDGVPMITPPAVATTSYPAAPTRTPPPPPPPAISSGPMRPPLTEAPAQPAAQLPPAEPPVRKRRRGRLIVAVIALVLLAGLMAGQLVRPVPAPKLRLTLSATRYTFGGPALDLPWPDQGQATLYAEGLGSMGSSGGQSPTPTASVAKVMTAYVVLHDHALRAGEDGPAFQISAEEAARLPERKQRGESLVEVVAGQEFTEHKALEALLIVSANNLAHELARWDAGDEQAFVEKMNAAARSLGMTSTTYTDPSGYDSQTVSTAADQVKLLTAAMKLPAFAEIVAMHTYEPNDGRPSRSGGDILVGRHGVIGGKTGYTDAAGGNFVFAARKRIGKTTTTIIGAVMGQQSPSAMGAIEAAQRLVVGAENALTSVTLAKAGSQVALVDDGLGGRVPLRASAPVTVVGWSGLTVPVHVTGDPPHQAAEGTRVGAVRAGSAVTPLTLDRDLNKPSILERLRRLA